MKKNILLAMAVVALGAVACQNSSSTEKVSTEKVSASQNEKNISPPMDDMNGWSEASKMAVMMIIANKELSFQTKEKKNRADELIIAKKELNFQTKEKKKRADEWQIANTELKFQNKEKRKRANELIIIAKELKLEIKRSDELIIAYKAVSDYKYALDQSSSVSITDTEGVIKHAAR